MKLLSAGCYIIESVRKPKYISLDCQEIISASPCICNMHPNLSGCFWQGHAAERSEYQRRLSLSESAYVDMEEKVSELFQTKRIDTDSRFVHLADAVNFYNTYLDHVAGLKIVSVLSTPKILSVLADDNGCGQNAPLSYEPVSGTYIGGEILGFDISSFHSYLCNSLDKVLSERYPLLYSTGNGLLQNSFDEIEEFSDFISDMGEPVDWLPFILHDCTPSL